MLTESENVDTFQVNVIKTLSNSTLNRFFNIGLSVYILVLTSFKKSQNRTTNHCYIYKYIHGPTICRHIYSTLKKKFFLIRIICKKQNILEIFTLNCPSLDFFLKRVGLKEFDVGILYKEFVFILNGIHSYGRPSFNFKWSNLTWLWICTSYPTKKTIRTRLVDQRVWQNINLIFFHELKTSTYFDSGTERSHNTSTNNRDNTQMAM